jgi:hypothetical protein
MDIFFGLFQLEICMKYFFQPNQMFDLWQFVLSVDTAISASDILAPLVAKLRYSCTVFTKINNITSQGTWLGWEGACDTATLKGGGAKKGQHNEYYKKNSAFNKLIKRLRKIAKNDY